MQAVPESAREMIRAVDARSLASLQQALSTNDLADVLGDMLALVAGLRTAHMQLGGES